MNECLECPICMESIETNKNCVKTECGHCFHANCLMTSVAHNGFGCPYCRASMAEEIKETDDDDDDYETIDGDEEEMFDEFSLRGFRFFMNNLANEEHDVDDIHEENEDQEEIERESESEREDTTLPDAKFVTSKLIQQGVTMEELVSALLSYHEEYDDNECLNNCESKMFGKFRIVISNYNRHGNQNSNNTNIIS